MTANDPSNSSSSRPLPFLRAVARAYTEHYDARRLERVCFVTPTKRAASFLAMHLAQERRSPAIGPSIITMGNLASRLAGRVEAPEIDSLFVLFRAHCDIVRPKEASFDRFRFWGRTILNDFDDIDSSLADAEELLDSVYKLQEISTDYLTDEQREIIATYWPHSLELRGNAGGRMWNHMHGRSGDGDQARAKSLLLWENLWPLYQAYNAAMDSRGMASPGRAQRLALERLEAHFDADEGYRPLGYDRFVFVGMARLSVAQLSIMRLLERHGLADFHWDTDSPFMQLDDRDGAGDFVRRYAEKFTSSVQLPPTAPDTASQQIVVEGCPSRVGQARVAVRQLAEWVEEKAIRRPDDAINTVVVLPEPELLLPLAGELPAAFSNVNITMGMPMRQTPLAALMHALFVMRSHAREWRGEPHFLAADADAVVSQPMLRSLAPEGCDGVASAMARIRSKMIPAAVCRDAFAGDGGLEVLFSAPGRDHDDASAWLDAVIAALSGRCEASSSRDAHLALLLLESYANQAARLRQAIADHDVAMGSLTFLQLVERVVSQSRVPFEGEPLNGLQIMSMLETRALDFDNVVILSMNDRVMPGRRSRPTFITETIRNAFGLPTRRHDEAVQAYNFYRLLSRARRVTLVYDSRTVGTRTSEMSRYLMQLLFLWPKAGLAEPRHRSRTFSPAFFERPLFEVEKTPRILGRLARYRGDYEAPEVERQRALSASAVNAYISCPLQFYLQYVEDFSTDDTATDFIDASTYGTVVHEVLERVYLDMLGGRPGGVVVTADLLGRYSRPNSLFLERATRQAINENFYRLPPEESDATPLRGESAIMASFVVRIVRAILRQEAEAFAPFTFIQAEQRETAVLDIAPGLPVRFAMYIDRVDEVGGRRRLVDYKTGGDTIKVNDMDALFTEGGRDRPKAVLQLLLYSRLYRRIHNYSDDAPLQPFIYKIGNAMTGQALQEIAFNKVPIDDDRPLAEEFNARFDAKVAEIFDPAVPFRMAAGDDHCRMCAFREVCGREGGK